MATAKMARPRGSTTAKENGVKLEEGLSAFRSDKFDADAFVQSRCSLNEKVRFVRSFNRSLLLRKRKNIKTISEPLRKRK